MNDFQVLVDSDAFVGRFYVHDAHHTHSLQLFDELQTERSYLVTTSMVVDEVATVLSHREGQALARQFLTVLDEVQFSIVHIDQALRQEALTMFKEQQQRGTSVTDCANVAVMRRFGIPRIFAFDQVYRKAFQLQVIQ